MADQFATINNVTVDYTQWVATFPSLAGIGLSSFSNIYLPLASLWFDTIGWPSGLTQAPQLLGLLTAHVAMLYAMRDAQGRPSDTGTVPPPQSVGRVSSAGQGSVNVSLEFETNQQPGADWYLQTSFGGAYWTATAQFRTGFYMPGPQRARRAAAASYVFPRTRAW